MRAPVEMGKNIALANFLDKYAEKVITADGSVYYRFIDWFQQLDRGFVMHLDLPNDLSEFIVKAGLGNPNPQIQKPKYE